MAADLTFVYLGVLLFVYVELRVDGIDIARDALCTLWEGGKTIDRIEYLSKEVR